MPVIAILKAHLVSSDNYITLIVHRYTKRIKYMPRYRTLSLCRCDLFWAGGHSVNKLVNVEYILLPFKPIIHVWF